jgi:hypothetical protein
MSANRYPLHDFFDASEFKTLEERMANHARFARHHRDRANTRVAALERDLGRVALLARALADLCLAKGLLTKEELARQILETDFADGAKDGRLDPDVLMPGEQKLAELEPLEKPVVRRRRDRR